MKAVTDQQPPRLPAPLRILADWDDYRRAVYAARGALDAFTPRPSVDHGHAEEMVTAALAAVGVFEPIPAPGSLQPTCTALYLPHDRTTLPDPEALGEWQQCAQNPGHGDAHNNDEFAWRDGDMGAVPATDPH